MASDGDDMAVKIYLSREKRSLGHPEARKLIIKAASAALRAEKVGESCEISVLLTDDEGMRVKNLEFRGVDRPTDVLSFPMNELTPGDFDPDICELDPETGRLLLGDMAISLERCELQGEEYGGGFAHELQYLTVHSVLHLLGYDHVDEGADKRLMRAREKAIMAGLE